jgi:hypothetical protein
MNCTESEVSCDTGLKQILNLFSLFRLYTYVVGALGGVVVKALRY